MHDFQVWLVTTIGGNPPIARFMQTAWAWPIAESLHFLGLCLLVGSIGTFDLRLLGVARSVPIAAVHRFIPWGLAGFALNIMTGLAVHPDRARSIHLQPVVPLQTAVHDDWRPQCGDVLSHVLSPRLRRLTRRSMRRDGESDRRDLAVRVVAVITGGRLLTFYRPAPCDGPQTRPAADVRAVAVVDNRLA